MPCLAQKAQITEAKGYLKSGKNLDKAESLMRSVLNMPEQRNILSNHVLLTDVVRGQYEQLNEQLYLKQLQDTTSIFLTLRRMFLSYEAMDSVDAQPDKKGRVKVQYRRRNAEYLNSFRPNLYKGGLYFFKNHKFQEAYDCMDTYIDCQQQPLFQQYDYAANDSMIPQAAYFAVTVAHRLKCHEGVSKYSALALQYKEKAHITLAMLYQDAIEMNDTDKAVAYLRQGFDKHSEFPFFFPRLIDHYISINRLDTVSAIVDKALDKEPGNLFYRLAKNTLQVNLGEYEACIALGDSLIHQNDKMAEAYMNVGTAYFNMAVKEEANGRESKQKRKRVNELYEKAMPYVERYRQLRSRNQSKWAPMLYTIYFNLNKGKEFEEVDRLIKQSKYQEK